MDNKDINNQNASPEMQKITWGAEARGMKIGITQPKPTYTKSELSENLFEIHLLNVTDKTIKTYEPWHLRDYGFIIQGPTAGDYFYKGPKPKWARRTSVDLINLKPQVPMIIQGSIWHYIEQKAGDVASIIPGEYKIRVRMGELETSEIKITIVD